MLFIGLFLITSLKKIFNVFGGSIFLFSLYYFSVSTIVLIVYDKDYFQQSFNFYLCIICFSLGYFAPNCDRSKIKTILAIYCFSSLSMGLYSVLRNVGSFLITDEYAVLLKNSSGVLVATGSIIAFYLSLQTKGKSVFFWLIVALLNFLCLLVFRARSAILATIIVYLIMAIKTLRAPDNIYSRRYVLGLIIIIVALSIIDILPMGFIYDALLQNKDTSDVESLSSGRTVMFDRAMYYFYRDPIAGLLSTNDKLQSVDNFVVNQLGRYGLIGMITNIPIYIFVWIVVIRGIIKSSVSNGLQYFALLILCIVSLTESPFPFGPGTPCVCAYVLWGIALNQSQNSVTK
jgi:membrane protein